MPCPRGCHLSLVPDAQPCPSDLRAAIHPGDDHGNRRHPSSLQLRCQPAPQVARQSVPRPFRFLRHGRALRALGLGATSSAARPGCEWRTGRGLARSSARAQLGITPAPARFSALLMTISSNRKPLRTRKAQRKKLGRAEDHLPDLLTFLPCRPTVERGARWLYAASLGGRPRPRLGGITGEPIGAAPSPGPP